MRFAAVGDCIIARRVSGISDVAFNDLVALVRGADATFANLEITTPKAPWTPFSEFGGMHLAAEPWVLDELRWMGLNLFGFANNHAVDYTFGGLLDTVAELNKRDMVFSGAGRNLGEARAPGYLDTPAGRAAVIGCASTFMTSAQAAQARTDMAGRPGINPLRHETEFLVTQEQMDRLVALDEGLGTAAVVRRHKAFGVRPDLHPDAYMFLGKPFKVADSPAVRTHSNPRDLDAIQKWIADARRQADFVVVGMHCHEGESTDSNSPTPAEFVVEAARAFIDAGADAFVGHGPHMLRAIEIHKGKPIFYSLGNFLFMFEAIARYPSEMYEQQKMGPDALPSDVHDSWSFDAAGRPIGFLADDRFWQSVLPVCDFAGGMLRGIDLHPIELALARPRSERGVPRLAGAEEGERILRNLAVLSAPFGTEIEVRREGGRSVGRVRLP